MGAASSSAEYIALVNPDLIVGHDTFERLLVTLRDRPEVAICGAHLLNPDGTEQRGGRREVLTPWRALTEALRLDRLFPRHPHFRRLNLHETTAPLVATEVPTVSGAFLVLSRAWWQKLGGMDERIFLHLEDTDLCLRALNLGGIVLFRGDIPVHHHLSTSDAPRIFIEWHKTRSAVYYFHKHFSATYPRWALRLVNFALWCRFVAVATRQSIDGLKWLWRFRYERLLRAWPASDPR
jgi:GT2 family glycosyltransferase